MNQLNEVTRHQALRALTASSETLAGVQIVRGTLAGLDFPWLLTAAHAFVRAGAGITAIVWDPDGPGLALLNETGVAYRFATVDPFTLPDTGPAGSTPDRHLRIVRSA